MNRLRILVVGMGFGLMSFLSMGCPYDGPHYPTTYGIPTATPTPIAPVAVTIFGSAYSPNPVTITHGGSVIWTNNDGYSHTVYTDDGSGTCATNNSLIAGSSVTLTFPNAMTIHYHCSIHNPCGVISCSGCTGSMAATVVVQ